MDNKTKVIVGLTFIMMGLIYQMGQQNSTVHLAPTAEAQGTTESSSLSTSFMKDVQYPVVSDVAVRIRIIPNSNSYEDQQAKKMVTFAIDEFLSKNKAALTSLESTREFIASNIKDIEATVEDVLRAISYTQGYEITYGAHLFPQKELNGKVYEEGYYESLVIKLGQGQGSNWWCFMNTELCLGPSAVTSDTEHWNSQYETTKQTQELIANQEVKFFFAEVWENLFGREDDTYVAQGQTDKSMWYLYEDEY